MITLIAARSPVPERYRHDGTEFRNEEGYLPAGPWYFEHRIDVGVGKATNPKACRIVIDSTSDLIYFTAGHYGKDVRGGSAFPFEGAPFYQVTGIAWSKKK